MDRHHSWREFARDLGWGVLLGATVGGMEMDAAYATTGRMDPAALVANLAYAAAVGLLAALPIAGLGVLQRRRSRVPSVAPRSLLVGVILGGFVFLRAIVNAIWQLWLAVQWNTLALVASTALSVLAAAAVITAVAAMGGRAERPGRSLYASFAVAMAVTLYGGFFVARWLGGSQGPGQYAVGAQGPRVFIPYLLCLSALAISSLWLMLGVPTRRAVALLAIAIVLPVLARGVSRPGMLSRTWTSPSEPSLPPANHHLPNVILIVLDTVRADHLELYGYARHTMPNLRSVAARGTTYLDVVSTSPWTLPAHASLFTGLYPSEHGAVRGKADSESPGFQGLRPLAEGTPVLAGILRSAGYRTAGIVANWAFLSPGWGLRRGFDYWDCRATFHGAASVEGYLPLMLRTLSLVDYLPIRWVYWPLERFDVAQTKIRRADVIDGEALAFLRAHQSDRERPFFLFLNYMDAHQPYLAPGEFRDRFPGRDPTKPRRIFGAARAGMSEQKLEQHLGSEYDSALAFLDDQLGRLFSYLETSGVLKDTLVIVTSDHGEALGEHGHVNHGNAVYEEEIRIPLVIVDPETDHPGNTVTQPIDIRYVAPWLLRRLKLPLPDGCVSQEQLRDGYPQISEVFGAPGKPRADTSMNLTDQIAIRENNLKAIVFSTGQVELYDLAHDPHEKVDLSGKRAELARQLRDRALAWLAARTRQQGGAATDLSREQIKRLRELGYVR